MMVYLIKSGICLTLLLAIYHLFLEREKMHFFNRWFLLASIVFSLCIPQILITVPSKIVPLEKNIFLQDVIISSNDTISVTDTPTIDAFHIVKIILFSIYGIGVLFFLIRFIKNLRELYKKISNNLKIKSKNALFILLKDSALPHSFLHYIFLNKDDYKNKRIEEELFTHELTHVNQKHSFDILFIELIKIIFWFNPVVYLFKKAIQLNHEFLADQSVINTHQNISTYQYMLLDKASWSKTSYLASNLNYSVTKKRLKMMTKNTSKTMRLLKKIALLPIAIGLLYLFSTKIEAQSEYITENTTDTLQSNISEEKEVIIIAEDIDIVINKNSEILVNDKLIFKENLNKAFQEINSHLSFEEKKSLVEASITADDATKMGFITDIEDIIIKNGVKTITLKKINEDSTVKSIRVSQSQKLQVLSESIIILINESGKLLVNENLSSLESIQRLIENLSQKEKQETTIRIKIKNNTPKVRVQEVKQLLRSNGILKINLENVSETKKSSQQDKATSDQVKEYNKLAKHYNNLSKDNLVIKLKDMTRIRELYDLMSDVQKKKAESLPNFPPPPPSVKRPPPPVFKKVPSKKTEQNKVKTGFINIKGKKHYAVTINNITRYYNRKGVQVTRVGKELNGGKQINATDVIPGQYITAVYQDSKIVSEFYKNKSELAPASIKRKAKMEDGSIREFEIIETPTKIPLKLDSMNKEITEIIKKILPVTKVQGEYLDKYATYKKDLKAYLGGSNTSSKNLTIVYNELVEIYNSFTEEDKELFHSFLPPPPPSKN